MWQAGREACSPVQLLQLLHQDWYPDEEAAALAAQARARVLIFSKTLAHVRAAAARHAVSLLPFPSISRFAAVALRWVGGGRVSIARRLVLLLLLLLLASTALFKFRRGGVVRLLQLLLRYKRR